MTQPPRISVVMPVFNGETYLAEAVKSVLGQSLQALELVAVDDGSQDGSGAILERFARADRRVQLVTNARNLGMSDALNRGWRLARGPYIARLDADDVALPDRLSRQADFLDAHPAVAAVGGATITIDRTGRQISTRRYPRSNRVIRSTLLRHNCLAHAAVTMRRSALQAVGGYRFPCAEDYDLWLRLSERFELANLTEPVILQRLHLTQQSVRILERDARVARAVCAAARVRRASGADPLARAREVTPDALDRLKIDEGELAAAVERELIARAAILADLGHRAEAKELIDQAWRLIGERAERAFAATVELKQAEGHLRARRPFAAARHVVLAFCREPRHASSLLTAWLAPRIPGGSLLKWT
jgi:glycosyltransferase involved in cell wall biosynthesis